MVVAAFSEARERLEEWFMAEGFKAMEVKSELGGGFIGPRMPDPVG